MTRLLKSVCSRLPCLLNNPAVMTEQGSEVREVCNNLGRNISPPGKSSTKRRRTVIYHKVIAYAVQITDKILYANDKTSLLYLRGSALRGYCRKVAGTKH